MAYRSPYTIRAGNVIIHVATAEHLAGALRALRLEGLDIENEDKKKSGGNMKRGRCRIDKEPF